MRKLKDILIYKRVLKSSKVLLNVSYDNSLLTRSLVPLKKQSFCILVLRSSLSNTFVNVTDLHGKVVFFSSCGCLGLRGKKKRTTNFAIESLLDSVVSRILELGFNKVLLDLSGFAKSGFSVLSRLSKSKIKLLGIKDATPIAHNGCRPKKLRRV